MPSQRLVLAYYCSGHGYGHGTRVSAFTSHLLQYVHPRPIVHIISSAPEHIFQRCLDLGAKYRSAEIDPVIVQPLAYCVDRQSSIRVLKAFLAEKDAKLAQEIKWLRSESVDCVLSDSAFLGCLAAHALQVPSVLVTNFTFDSVYSFLSTSLLDSTRSNGSNYQAYQALDALISDIPVSQLLLGPLVDEIVQGYRCADLLLLLPGFIPIPSFSDFPSLPAPQWVRNPKNRFTSAIISYLKKSPRKWTVPESIPYATESDDARRKRSVVRAPLLVRPTNIKVYTFEGRSEFLSSIGVPSEFHDPTKTRILIVSFGGQVFKKPVTSSGGRTPQKCKTLQNAFQKCSIRSNSCEYLASAISLPPVLSDPRLDIPQEPPARSSPRIATDSHIWVPGAPPAIKRDRGLNSPLTPHSITSPKSLTVPSSPAFPSITKVVPPTPPLPSYNDGSKRCIRGLSIFSQKSELFMGDFTDSTEDEDFAQPTMLPAGWIGIVCGASKEHWEEVSETGEYLGLPEGFFIAPQDVYMPDLTAVADVLLGKLGYGTCAECVDSQTPFVYVSRPLFIEEHGLRLLLADAGVGVELTRRDYEQGRWSLAIEAAWFKGRHAKEAKRQQMMEKQFKASRIQESVKEEEEEDSGGVVGRMARALASWVMKRKEGDLDAEFPPFA